MTALQKLRSLVKQIIDPALIGSGNLIANTIAALFWFYLATILSTEDYGQVNYSLAIASIASTASILGSNTTATTYFAKGNQTVLRQASFLVLLISASAALAVALFSKDIPAAILLLGLSSFTMTLAETLGGKRYKHFTLLMISNRISQVVLSLGLYYVIGTEGIIIGYAISSMAFGYRIFRLKRSSLSFSELRPKFSFMMHSYSLSMSQAVVAYADKLIITALFGLSILGLYQLGFQFLMFLSVIPSSLYQYLLPNEASGVERKTVRKFGLIVAIVLAFVFYAASPSIITWLFPQYVASIPAAQIMAFGVIPLTLNSIMNSRFLGRENSRPVLFGAVTYITSLVLSLYLLGNLMGLVGMAFGVVLSLSSQSLILWLLSKRQDLSSPVTRIA